MTAPAFAVISAPPTPWTRRKTISEISPQASAHASDPAMKTRKPASYARTRPNMSPRRPTCVESTVITSR